MPGRWSFGKGAAAQSWLAAVSTAVQNSARGDGAAELSTAAAGHMEPAGARLILGVQEGMSSVLIEM